MKKDALQYEFSWNGILHEDSSSGFEKSGNGLLTSRISRERCPEPAKERDFCLHRYSTYNRNQSKTVMQVEIQ
jgi:hypothetical protein